MAKIALAALVVVWMFNLARFIASGPSHDGTIDQGTSFDATRAAAAHAAPLALPADVAILIRAADDGSDKRTRRVGVMLAESEVVHIDLYDRAGRRLHARTTGPLPAGHSLVELDVEHLPAGDYWVRARAGDQLATAYLAIGG